MKDNMETIQVSFLIFFQSYCTATRTADDVNDLISSNLMTRKVLIMF